MHIAQEKRGRTCFVQFPLLRQNGPHGRTDHAPAMEASEQEGGTVPREASRQRLKMTSVPQRVEWLTRLPRKPVAPNEGTVSGGVGLPAESCHLSGVIAQGRRQRKRTVQVHEQYGGTPCEGSTSEADSCGSPICREGVYLKYCLRTQKDNILQIILELYLSGDQIAWGIWPS